MRGPADAGAPEDPRVKPMVAPTTSKRAPSAMATVARRRGILVFTQPLSVEPRTGLGLNTILG